MDEYVLYGRVDTKEIVLESWGASTKHPDMIEHFTEWADYENAKQYLVCPQEDNGFIFQWLLNCASRRLFPFHTFCLMEYARKYYEYYQWAQHIDTTARPFII